MSFWTNLRVCVPGGNGFVGKHLTHALWERGCGNVSVPDIKLYDLCSRAAVNEMYGRHEPDIVINLAAAVGGVAANTEKPGLFFYTNLMIGTNLMEAGRIFGIGKFVQMGSACEYPKDAECPLKEENLWSGYPEESNAPYGIAKRALLVQGQAYRKQYGMNVIHLLSSNLYGPGDNFDSKTSHVIPALIKKCFDAKKNANPFIEVWGSGGATRDFLYVKDVVEGLLLATEFYNEPEPVNLGSGVLTTISHIAYSIKRLIGYSGEILWGKGGPEGQKHRLLDTSKAGCFGFTAKTPLKQGLIETIKWYEEQCEKSL